MATISKHTSSPSETRILAADVARSAQAGDVLGLIGSLGAGKTEFVRGFVAALDTDVVVRSPSFTLVNTYDTDSFRVHHLDFYRLSAADELLEIGFNEYLDDEDAVCLIEWADMFPHVLPGRTRLVRFEAGKGEERTIVLDQ